jgi:peptidoglycan/xylan/chitin deacetylase (PgdA/CDA1 family)
LVGQWAAQHAALVHQMQATGIQAGTPYAFCNHGYRDHGWALLGLAQAGNSIRQADAVIERLTGSKPLYFSPHKGEFNAAVLEASRQAGHELILWSLDTIDWRHPSPSAMRDRIVSRVQPGDIILMHPTAETVQALPEMIAGIRAKGLRLTTLNQLLGTQWPAGGTSGTAPRAKG